MWCLVRNCAMWLPEEASCCRHWRHNSILTFSYLLFLGGRIFQRLCCDQSSNFPAAFPPASVIVLLSWSPLVSLTHLHRTSLHHRETGKPNCSPELCYEGGLAFLDCDCPEWVILNLIFDENNLSCKTQMEAAQPIKWIHFVLCQASCFTLHCCFLSKTTAEQTAKTT